MNPQKMMKKNLKQISDYLTYIKSSIVPSIFK